MRFKQRSIVLLPHPDGPMTAVTVCAGNRIDTSLTTARRPYRAVSRTASSCSRASAGGAMAGAQRPAGGDGEEQHEGHEDQCRRPRQAGALVETPGCGPEELGGKGYRPV